MCASRAPQTCSSRHFRAVACAHGAHGFGHSRERGAHAHDCIACVSVPRRKSCMHPHPHALQLHLRRSTASGRWARPRPASSTRRAHARCAASGSSRGDVAFPLVDLVARSEPSRRGGAPSTIESRSRGSLRLDGCSAVRPAQQSISVARPAWQSNGRIAHAQCEHSAQTRTSPAHMHHVVPQKPTSQNMTSDTV